MRKYTYNSELRIITTMFMSALDDVVVKRFQAPDFINAVDSIKVRFVYAPKQRVLAELLDKAQNLQLPVIAVTIGGIRYDPTRVFNKIQGSYMTSADPTKTNKLLQPSPIDIDYNVSILCRYSLDYEQILTNILTYFQPYIIVSWRTPSTPDYEIRSQAIWSGSVNTTWPYDINSTNVARIQGETSFTFKGWFFKAAPSGPESTILTVNSNFSTRADLMSKYSLDDLDPLTTERHMISAVPQPRVIN